MLSCLPCLPPLHAQCIVEVAWLWAPTMAGEEGQMGVPMEGGTKRKQGRRARLCEREPAVSSHWLPCKVMESKRETDGKSKKETEKGREKVTKRFEKCIIIYLSYGIQYKPERTDGALRKSKVGTTQQRMMEVADWTTIWKSLKAL